MRTRGALGMVPTAVVMGRGSGTMTGRAVIFEMFSGAMAIPRN